LSAEPESAQPALEAVAEQARVAATGILTAARGKLRRLFCFEKGSLVFATSNVIEEQFEEFLVRQQILSPAQRSQARLEGSRQGKSLVLQLRDSRLLQEDRLVAALEKRIAGLLESTLTDREMRCSFARGRPNLEGELPVALSCVPAILNHVRTHPASVQEVRIRIGPPNMRPRLTRAAARLLHGQELPAEAEFLRRQADGRFEIPELLTASPESNESTLRALYGLLLLGIMEPAKADETGAGAEQPVTRDEVLARTLRATESNHYQLLGLEPSATTDQIRDAYYLLARRYHPDRFRTGPLSGLLVEIETYFTQVTEAYNTLHDADLRAQYDEELSLGQEKQEAEPAQDARFLARENYARAKVLIDRKRFQEAVTFLENAIDLAEDVALYHVELGRILALNPRRRPEAEEHLLRGADLDPAKMAARYELGLLFRKTGRHEEAIAAFEEVLRWEATHEGAQTQLLEMGQTPSGRPGGWFGG